MHLPTWFVIVALVWISVGWVLTLWLLAKRSFALVDIAQHGHLSGHSLAQIAHETLGRTGARNFKKDYEEIP